MKNVYIVSAIRSPQVKANLELHDTPAPYLGSYLVRNMMDDTDLPEDSIDEVIFGNTGNPAKYPNIGRVIALEAGLDKRTSAYSVNRNCASGMEAVASGFLKIAAGRSDLIVVGGVESMSQMPLIFDRKMTKIFQSIMKTKSPIEKLKICTQFRPSFLIPIIAIEQGLTDPFCGLNMGMTAERLSQEFHITREEQDKFAHRSHTLAIKATEEGRWKDEILPIILGANLSGTCDKDKGPRKNSTLEGLAKMRPYFDRRSGTVTIGNSCPLTDGGSAILLASDKAVEKYNLNPIAKIKDYHFHGLEPERMGLGPALAIDGLLKRTDERLDNMDLVEINEAFAAQVLACQKIFSDQKIASQFGIDTVWGEVPDEKLNVNGGAISLGHPIGSTGCRLIVTLVHELKRRKQRLGIASLCIGGGQGGAMMVENLRIGSVV